MNKIIKKLFNNKNNREELILLSEFVLTIELKKIIKERGERESEKKASLKETLELMK